MTAPARVTCSAAEVTCLKRVRLLNCLLKEERREERESGGQQRRNRRREKRKGFIYKLRENGHEEGVEERKRER